MPENEPAAALRDAVALTTSLLFEEARGEGYVQTLQLARSISAPAEVLVAHAHLSSRILQLAVDVIQAARENGVTIMVEETEEVTRESLLQELARQTFEP